MSANPMDEMLAGISQMLEEGEGTVTLCLYVEQGRAEEVGRYFHEAVSMFGIRVAYNAEQTEVYLTGARSLLTMIAEGVGVPLITMAPGTGEA